MFIGRNEQLMSRQVGTLDLSYFSLIFSKSLFRSAKNIKDQYQSPRGLARNNRKFDFVNIINVLE